MTTTLKIIITSILVGIVTYMLIGFIDTQALTIPTDAIAFAELLVIVAAILLSCFITSTSGRSLISSDRESGTVKWFNVKKGYGFITRDQGDDVFVHYRSIEGDGRRTISEGQRVSFIVTDGDKGLQADEVTAA